MTDLTEYGRAILASQPFSALIGAELTELKAGYCEIRLSLRPDLAQQHGFAHGGVLAYLADNSLTFAGGTRLSGMIVTAEMKINYVRPAIGDTLVARATCLSAGKTQAVVRSDLYVVRDGAEHLCAAAQGTIVAANSHQTAQPGSG